MIDLDIRGMVEYLGREENERLYICLSNEFDNFNKYGILKENFQILK